MEQATLGRAPKGSAANYRCAVCKASGVTAMAVGRFRLVEGDSRRTPLCLEHRDTLTATRRVTTGTPDTYAETSRAARDTWERDAQRAAWHSLTPREIALIEGTARARAKGTDALEEALRDTLLDGYVSALVDAARRAFPRPAGDTFSLPHLPGPSARDRTRLLTRDDVRKASTRRIGATSRSIPASALPWGDLPQREAFGDRIRMHGVAWSNAPSAEQSALRRMTGTRTGDVLREDVLALLPSPDAARLRRLAVRAGNRHAQRPESVIPTGVRVTEALRRAAAAYVAAAEYVTPSLPLTGDAPVKRHAAPPVPDAAERRAIAAGADAARIASPTWREAQIRDIAARMAGRFGEDAAARIRHAVTATAAGTSVDDDTRTRAARVEAIVRERRARALRQAHARTLAHSRSGRHIPRTDAPMGTPVKITPDGHAAATAPYGESYPLTREGDYGYVSRPRAVPVTAYCACIACLFAPLAHARRA